MSKQLGLKRIRVRNYRSLADVSLDLEPINILSAPNGTGKSTLLDTLWFVRDCAFRSVEDASSLRNHGIGLLYDGAEEFGKVFICIIAIRSEYEFGIQFSSGRIEPYPFEHLFSFEKGQTLIHRRLGSHIAEFNRPGSVDVSADDASADPGDPEHMVSVNLREPEKLTLSRYLDLEPSCEEAEELELILQSIRFYNSRSFKFSKLKSLGSEVSHEILVKSQAENLWSVLRNIEGRRQVDDRYLTIMGYMSEAFPDFKGLVIEPTGPGSLYASFLEKNRREPILASGVSDGHLQMLIVLTALFSEGRDRYSLVLFDEPDLSLHPWALAVMARAIKHAAENWSKQIILTTHSPVLMSQFEVNQNLAVETRDGQTHITRLSEMEGVQDDLEHYASGSLYMSETIAPQSGHADLSTVRTEP